MSAEKGPVVVPLRVHHIEGLEFIADDLALFFLVILFLEFRIGIT